MRFLSALALLLLAGLAGAVTTTSLDCKSTTDCINHVTQAAVNATENIVTVTVTAGHPVTVQVYADTAWYYRPLGTDGVTHDSTTQEPHAANQVDKIRLTQTTTFYFVRQTADGTLYLRPLRVE